MSIFGNILKKLGFGDDSEKLESGGGGGAAEDTEMGEDVVNEPYTGPLGDEEEGGNEVYDPGSEEAAELMVKVDVTAKLDVLAAESPENLDWRVSIVDLMKLLDIDSSYTHRKELAAEVGIEGYEGTAEQNIQLHKTVLARLAENGGNVPADLFG